MKKTILTLGALALTVGAFAKADKLCWTGATQVWPQAETFGLQARVGDSSGGATARVDYRSFAFANLLTKVTMSVHGVTTVNYYTNNAFSVELASDWKGAVTLPYDLLCNFSGNYAQVQVWAFPAGTPVGNTGYTSYASAKITGN